MDTHLLPNSWCNFNSMTSQSPSVELLLKTAPSPDFDTSEFFDTSEYNFSEGIFI